MHLLEKQIQPTSNLLPETKLFQLGKLQSPLKCSVRRVLSYQQLRAFHLQQERESREGSLLLVTSAIVSDGAYHQLALETDCILWSVIIHPTQLTLAPQALTVTPDQLILNFQGLCPHSRRYSLDWSLLKLTVSHWLFYWLGYYHLWTASPCEECPVRRPAHYWAVWGDAGMCQDW